MDKKLQTQQPKQNPSQKSPQQKPSINTPKQNPIKK